VTGAAVVTALREVLPQGTERCLPFVNFRVRGMAKT
jgi:hypothetical protein